MKKLTMKKLIVILGGVLALQVVLAVTMNMSADNHGAFSPQEKLLAFDSNAVNGIRIDDGKNSLLISKKDGKWRLPDDANFQANEADVDKLLQTLANLKKGWPVAKTHEAANRFKVADDTFERKLSLLSDGKTIATLYVGTSPQFRKAHVRAAKQDDIYSAALNTYDINAKADDWIDKTVLTLLPEDITRIDMPGYTLEHDKDKLTLAELSDKETTDDKAAKNLLHKLSTLTIESVLGTEAKPEYQQDKAELEFKVTRKNGDVLDYKISKPKQGSYYVLKRSDMDDYFKLASYTVKPLETTKREQLVKLKTESEPTKAAAGNNTSQQDNKPSKAHG